MLWIPDCWLCRLEFFSSPSTNLWRKQNTFVGHKILCEVSGASALSFVMHTSPAQCMAAFFSSSSSLSLSETHLDSIIFHSVRQGRAFKQLRPCNPCGKGKERGRSTKHELINVVCLDLLGFSGSNLEPRAWQFNTCIVCYTSFRGMHMQILPLLCNLSKIIPKMFCRSNRLHRLHSEGCLGALCVFIDCILHSKAIFAL